MILDSDLTCTSEYMPNLLLKEYGLDIAKFWQKKNKIQNELLAQGIKAQDEAVYTSLILRMVRNRSSPLYRLTRSDLMKLGKKLPFYPGVKDFFKNIREDISAYDKFRKNNLELEFHIVSGGLADMLRGSDIADAVGKDNIYGCEFMTNSNDVITDLAHVMTFTEKTRAIFQVSKGDMDVNAKIDDSYRRVPLDRIIYTGDGPTDVAAFSIVKRGGGVTIAVYDIDREDPLKNVGPLVDTQRVKWTAQADYSKGSILYSIYIRELKAIADRIDTCRKQIIEQNTTEPPRH